MQEKLSVEQFDDIIHMKRDNVFFVTNMMTVHDRLTLMYPTR